MGNTINDLYLFVRLKKNDSRQNIIKGQHFRLVCEDIEGRELTYLEKLAKLETDERCVVDPEKYDKCQIPLGYAVVDCKDLEDITKEVLDKGLLFFTESSFFGDKDDQEEMKKEEKELMKYVDDMYDDLSPDTETESEED